MKAGKIIQLLRVGKGIPQKELAVQLGVTSPYLSQVETGKKDASLKLCKRVAEVFKIPLPLLHIESSNCDEEIMGKLREMLGNILLANIAKSEDKNAY